MIDAALSRPATIAEQAELRCQLALSYLFQGKLQQAATEARRVPDRQDVPEDAREEASVLLMRVLAKMPDQQQAEAWARTVLAARQPSSSTEVTTAVGLLTRVRWRDGRLAEGLRLYRESSPRSCSKRARTPTERATARPVTFQRPLRASFWR